MVKVAAAPQTQTIVYSQFKGVDFSQDDYMVDRNHSPYALNMISDKGGQPEKRVGWRVMAMIDMPVNGIQQGTIGTENMFIAHGGTKLYKWVGNTVTVIKGNVKNERSSIFFAEHKGTTKCFILTGNEYLVYDGNSVVDVSTIATIPLFEISRNPTTGGGTQLNPLNLLQSGFTESFLGVADIKEYKLSFGNLDATAVTAQVMDSAGNWVNKAETTDFSVNRTTGIITFTTAPGESPITGVDNVKITAYRTVEGYANRIKKCLTYSQYGLGSNNRIFVTRNSDYKAQDWWSELNDPTYFPDINYAVIGTTNTAIMGYAKQGENQIIIKEDNQQDTTIFARTATLQGEKTTFPVKIGVTGVGAISPYSFSPLIDEPLFLARSGIYAITSNAVTFERTLQNRSYYVDSRLTKEPNLEKATAIQWDNYYIISVNGNAYLLDGRQRSASPQNSSNMIYECFYWNNIYATCFMVYNGELYFGTATGQLCKFNTDIATMQKYNDNNEAITAMWTTKLDDDGIPNATKTMQKKGCSITTKPFTRSWVEVGIKTSDMGAYQTIKQQALGILDFNDIDFEYFTFVSNDNARNVVLGKKTKKYKALQFIIKNDKINQGLGIFNIVKTFNRVNYIKER